MEVIKSKKKKKIRDVTGLANKVLNIIGEIYILMKQLMLACICL